MNSHNNFSLSHCSHEVCDAFGPSVCSDYDDRTERNSWADDKLIEKPESRIDELMHDAFLEEGGEEAPDISVPDTNSSWEADEAKDRFAC